MLEVSSRLRWFHKEIFTFIQCGDELKTWCVLVLSVQSNLTNRVTSLGSRVIILFLRVMSLVPITNENLKLKLASDTTQLEFTLNQLFSYYGMKMDATIPREYAALKAMKYALYCSYLVFICLYRPTLFLESKEFETTSQAQSLPTHVVLNLLITKAHPAISMPHDAYNWSETKFSKWTDGQNEESILKAYDRCLDKYASEVAQRGEKEFCVEYPIMRDLISKRSKHLRG